MTPQTATRIALIGGGMIGRLYSGAKFLTLVLAAIILVRLLTLSGYPILDRTEARYAYIAELMVQTGNWITPFFDHNVPYWGKPVLSFWLTALSFVAFGINAFAARLPAFLIFAGVCWFTLSLGRDERGKEFGLTAACIFATTLLGFYLGGTVMTDPALMLGITITMASFWRAVAHPNDESVAWKYLFFIGLAIGTLAKGPIAIVLPGLSITLWATWHRRWVDIWRRLPWVTGVALTLVLVAPWYVAAEIHTPGFLHYFLVGEHLDRFLFSHWQGDLYGAGRNWPRGTIWLFLIIATLPWSAILLSLLVKRQTRNALLQQLNLSDPWLSYLLFWFLAPLVVFTFAANIVVTYIAPSLPAFALLCADALQYRIREPLGVHSFVATAAITPSLFLAAVSAIIVYPDARYVPTQANIYTMLEKRTSERQPALDYVFDFPYSAKFYSAGTAKYLRDENELVAALDKGGRYFVIPVKSYPKLSEGIRNRLEFVTQQNGHLLLRSK
jgi:4-amino-4-deoxy-L-arabinose transferase-like glycosyltransferase